MLFINDIFFGVRKKWYIGIVVYKLGLWKLNLVVIVDLMYYVF